MKIKPITAYAVQKNNRINALDIFNHKDLELGDTEELITVAIVPKKQITQYWTIDYSASGINQANEIPRFIFRKEKEALKHNKSHYPKGKIIKVNMY